MNAVLLTQSLCVLSAVPAAIALPPADAHPFGPLSLAGILALAEAVAILALLGANRRLRARIRQGNPTAAADDSAAARSALASLYEKALTGSLDRFSVTEVIQFLHSIQETGILDIVDRKVAAVHRMVLQHGDIIDAFNGGERGEPAVLAIMRCTEGTFTFIRGDVPGRERTVRKPTMTLLMEAMQSLDERHSAAMPAPSPRAKLANPLQRA
jgi:hypothetical protein